MSKEQRSKEQRMMDGARSHLRSAMSIVEENDAELFTEPRLRAAAAQAAEAHRMFERLIGRVEVQNEQAREQEKLTGKIQKDGDKMLGRIGSDNDPMKYVAGA